MFFLHIIDGLVNEKNCRVKGVVTATIGSYCIRWEITNVALDIVSLINSPFMHPKTLKVYAWV